MTSTFIYRSCPAFFTPHFTLRMTTAREAGGLLRVYRDRQARPYFITDDSPMAKAIEDGDAMLHTLAQWRAGYEAGQFVRWTIFEASRPIGTVEMGRRVSQDKWNGCGLLRIDLDKAHQFSDIYDELLDSLLPALFQLFACRTILIKASGFMVQRRESLTCHGFRPVDTPLIDGDGLPLAHYWAVQA